MAPPGAPVSALFEFTNGLISQTVWGFFFLQKVKQIKEIKVKGFFFFEIWNSSTNTERARQPWWESPAAEALSRPQYRWMELQITVQTAAGPLFCMCLAPRIIFHLAPSHAHSQFPAVTFRSHQLFRSFVGNSWCHPSDGRSVCWRHYYKGAPSHFGARRPSWASTLQWRKWRGLFLLLLLPVMLAIELLINAVMTENIGPYIIHLFTWSVYFGLSNFSDSSFSAESSASDIIAASGLCGGIYLASAVAAGPLTLITKSPPRTPT